MVKMKTNKPAETKVKVVFPPAKYRLDDETIMEIKKGKPAEISLSDKIFQGRKLLSIYHHNKPMILAEDLKEAVKDILERIDKAVYKWMKDLGIFESAESVNIPDVLDLEKEIIDIIKSEMGERLTK